MDGTGTGPAPLPSGDPGRVMDFLRDGGRLAVLTGASRASLGAVLDGAFWSAPGVVIRTGNPLSTPLSLSRLLLQVGADPHAEDEARALREGVAARAAGRDRVVLSIDDAHTLEADALPALRGLLWPDREEVGGEEAGRTGAGGDGTGGDGAGGDGAGGELAVQLVMSGRAGLLERLEAAGFRELEDPARTLVMVLAAAEAASGAEEGPELRPRMAPAVPLVPPPPAPLVRSVRSEAVAAPVMPVVPAVPLPLERPALLRRSVEADTVDREAEGGEDAGGGPAPVEVRARRPARRRVRTLILAALTGLFTGLALGLAVLWAAGELDFLGLPPSPLRRFLVELVVPAATVGSPAADAAPVAPLPASSVPAGSVPAVPSPASPSPADPEPTVVQPESPVLVRPAPGSDAMPVAPGPGPAPVEPSGAGTLPAAMVAPVVAPIVAPTVAPAGAPAGAPLLVPNVEPAGPVAGPPAQAAVVAPVVVPGTTEARLRRDFEAYLRHTGWTGSVRTPEAREALFRDYKDWLARSRTGPAPGSARPVVVP